jgi:hypothetical protein
MGGRGLPPGIRGRAVIRERFRKSAIKMRKAVFE